jgi:hypothetical protein
MFNYVNQAFISLWFYKSINFLGLLFFLFLYLKKLANYPPQKGKISQIYSGNKTFKKISKTFVEVFIFFKKKNISLFLGFLKRKFNCLKCLCTYFESASISYQLLS